MLPLPKSNAIGGIVLIGLGALLLYAAWRTDWFDKAFKGTP